MRWQDFIEQRPEVMLGKPVFKRTRLTVEHILRELSYGAAESEVLRGYPIIGHEQVLAALACAADVLAEQKQVSAIAR